MKYNQVINALQKATPILDNADELTDVIMQKVEKIPVNTRQFPIMCLWGIVSGIAASALICLFVYETFKSPLSQNENHPASDFLRSTSPSNVYFQKIAELDMQDKGKIIGDVIKRKEMQRARKEQLKLAFPILLTKE